MDSTISKLEDKVRRYKLLSSLTKSTICLLQGIDHLDDKEKAEFLFLTKCGLSAAEAFSENFPGDAELKAALILEKNALEKLQNSLNSKI